MRVYVFGVGWERDLVMIRAHARALGIPEGVPLVSCLALPNPHYALREAASDKALLAWFRETPSRRRRFSSMVALAASVLQEHGSAVALKEQDPDNIHFD